MIAKGKKGFNPGNETFVCSNHFVNGKPTQRYPYPTLALVSPSSQHRKPFLRICTISLFYAILYTNLKYIDYFDGFLRETIAL